ncbi:MAG: hypothetical protein WC272_08285 [Sulfurimonas sp.]|jgi:hypothetical protein
MPISRELALKILKYLLNNPSFYFPFLLMCKGLDGSDDFVEIIAQDDDLELLLNNKEYQIFELWENLQNLKEDTLALMSKGFIEKIVHDDASRQIETAAKEYRNLWKIDICESVKIEEYGFNEFLGGKAEGFEESLEILKEHMSKSYK